MSMGVTIGSAVGPANLMILMETASSIAISAGAAGGLMLRVPGCRIQAKEDSREVTYDSSMGVDQPVPGGCTSSGTWQDGLCLELLSSSSSSQVDTIIAATDSASEGERVDFATLDIPREEAPHRETRAVQRSCASSLEPFQLCWSVPASLTTSPYSIAGGEVVDLRADAGLLPVKGTRPSTPCLLNVAWHAFAAEKRPSQLDSHCGMSAEGRAVAAAATPAVGDVTILGCMPYAEEEDAMIRQVMELATEMIEQTMDDVCMKNMNADHLTWYAEVREGVMRQLQGGLRDYGRLTGEAMVIAKFEQALSLATPKQRASKMLAVRFVATMTKLGSHRGREWVARSCEHCLSDLLKALQTR